MIKITRFFYINLLVIPLFIGAYFAGVLNTLVLSYCVVAVHELFHLFAAIFLKVRVKSIIMMPFGMTLRLESNIIKSPAKEAIIAFCGPFSNALMALGGIILYLMRGTIGISQTFFIILNIVIGALNLLPALPLDGGRILRAILTDKIGFLGAVEITGKITRFCAIIVFLTGTVIFCLSGVNISLITVGAFILLSMISDGKNNEYIIMKEVLYANGKIKKGEIMRTKLVIADKDATLGELIKRFDYSSFHLIGVIDEKKRVKKLVTECEVVDLVVKKSTASTADEL